MQVDTTPRAHNARKKFDRQVTYFVQAEAGGPVRIGKSTQPAREVVRIQEGCPWLVRLLHITDTPKHELHARFAHLRLGGSWFGPPDEIVAYLLGEALS